MRIDSSPTLDALAIAVHAVSWDSTTLADGTLTFLNIKKDVACIIWDFDPSADHYPVCADVVPSNSF